MAARKQAAPVSDAEREEIVAALRAGESIYGVAKRTGRSKDTISRIGRKAGHESSAAKNSAIAAMTAARRHYSSEARRNALDLAFERVVGAFQAEKLTPREGRDAAIWLGTVIDKMRLEEGQATSRNETLTPDDLKGKLLTRIEAIAARQGAAPADGA